MVEDLKGILAVMNLTVDAHRYSRRAGKTEYVVVIKNDKNTLTMKGPSRKMFEIFPLHETVTVELKQPQAALSEFIPPEEE